jgi:hypothetical protein
MKQIAVLMTLALLVAMQVQAKVDLGIPKGECRIPEERRGNTDWFSDAGWGVFVHFLWDCQCVGKRSARVGTHKSWDECVNNFDTERFASDIAETGAEYVIFTMMQRTRYIVAPNETYNRLTGYKTGEACSTRDLVADLITSLKKRDIKLMLYWTGDGPRQDAQGSKGMGGWNGKVSDAYVQNWADVAAEYGKRYGKDVHGWWVDGCYEYIGYNQKRWSILAKGLRAGNPKRIIALNNPTMHHANSSTLEDDFTTGENNRFGEVPSTRWVDGVQWHTLSFLGKRWCDKGVRYSSDWLANYVYNCTRVGGVVSIDVLLYSDGSIDRAHIDTLKGIAPGIEALSNRKPVPEGNQACYKPARLLNLAGTRGLVVCRDRVASQGTDGDPDTFAQAGGEYPWTYEVDLQGDATQVDRIVVSFDKNAYATHFEIALSAGGKDWRIVAEKADHDGSKFEIRFDPVAARYIRIIGKKPDGPNQKGGQMGIGEVEVY